MEYPIEGVKVEELEGNESYEKFLSQQNAYKEGFIRLLPYNQIMPKEYIKYAKRIHDFEVKDDDVWISSFPKCGTTWTQEMVWCIMNDLDFKAAKETILENRVPFFELRPITEEISAAELTNQADTEWIDDTIGMVENLKSPRIIKTHLSWQMLPQTLLSNKNAKIIYVTRNPRDACVSYHNHWKILEGYHGGFEAFAESFISDIAGYYSPFIHHVLEYWSMRHRDVCFITYEEMKNDLASVIRKFSAFLTRPVAEEKISSLVDHLSFDKMKKNKSVNKQEFVEASQVNLANKNPNKEENLVFMRKGQVGDWKNYFTPELENKFEEWERKWLKDSDLTFQYSL